MQILNQIQSVASFDKISFIVIGGHAVNAYGFSRQTGDLDLLVSKSDKEYWINLFIKFNYKQFQEHDVFARFKSENIAAWPIDLMFVKKSVFHKLFSDSLAHDFGGFKCNIPSLKHMIALKLHALKTRQLHREGKDILDVQELLKISDMHKEDLRQLCKQYGRIDLYEQFKRYTRK